VNRCCSLGFSHLKVTGFIRVVSYAPFVVSQQPTKVFLDGLRWFLELGERIPTQIGCGEGQMPTAPVASGSQGCSCWELAHVGTPGPKPPPLPVADAAFASPTTESHIPLPSQRFRAPTGHDKQSMEVHQKNAVQHNARCPVYLCAQQKSRITQGFSASAFTGNTLSKFT